MSSSSVERRRRTGFLTAEITSFIIAAISGCLLVWQLVFHEGSNWTLAFTGVTFSLSAATLTWFLLNPDSVRAAQTEEMLTLARQTLASVQGDIGSESAQRVCELLLPNSAAVAVAITDCENVLGYAGHAEVDDPAGGPIRTRATQEVVENGQPKTLMSAAEIGFPFEPRIIKAAIIIPLFQGRRVFGTLKFYYRSPRKINETQSSIAEGFGQLLSTQLSAVALEEQTQLATSMELKALQAQINPHFLFNTINTIASFVRTDPDRARDLLREFAVFYRHTLENTGDLVSLSREVEQTMRYFYFEVARFGEDKLLLTVDFDDGVEDILIPSFLIQPLVENAVRHARPTEGRLTIEIRVMLNDNILVLEVADDGVGMSEEQRQTILHPQSRSGLGIAVKNVHDRVESYFGEGSHMEVESEIGKGTTVRLVMNLDSENLERLIERVNAAKAAAEAAEPVSQAVVGDTLVAATVSAEEISAAEVRFVDNMAAVNESTGLAEKFREELSEIDELNSAALVESEDVFDDDDDWDYEEEMSQVHELTDEEWEALIASHAEE